MTYTEAQLRSKKLYKVRHPDRVRAQAKDYYARTKDRKKQPDPEARRVYMRDYKKARRLRDPNYRLMENLRSRLGLFLKGYKTSPTQRLVGCTAKELRLYIESLFLEGMTWDNYGEWHVDHKVPLSSVDPTDLNALKTVCHYSNLQPLWAKDNIAKGGVRGP